MIQPKESKNSDERKKIFWKLPFKKCVSQEAETTLKFLNRNLKDVKISIAYTTLKTSSFFRNKDQVQTHLKSHVVYEFSCGFCPKKYIGETTRHLGTRINEHLTEKSKPTEIYSHEHEAKEEDFKILFHTNYTKTAEALFIKNEDQQILLNENKHQIPIYLF